MGFDQNVRVLLVLRCAMLRSGIQALSRCSVLCVRVALHTLLFVMCQVAT